MAATGQTINDRLNAVRYALAGQGLARTVCKATTEEVIGPKKKHIDYLLACTNEPNISIPQLANSLIERTQHTNWAVVFKALISTHHLMSFGNERFTQYLATSNHSFELNDFMDRTTPQGYNMSTFVRRYAKYVNQKSVSYRTLAIDLCKIRSGNDNALRTMNMDNLSKTLPIVQAQFDALLEFEAETKDLGNGIIMAAFRLLYKDLVRLYVAYQEAIINLLERYFKLSRKKTREALEMYKRYLGRMDKVAGFLRVVDAVGLDKSEMPDLTNSPASILRILEQHLAQLEAKKRGATPVDTQEDQPEADGKENSEPPEDCPPTTSEPQAPEPEPAVKPAEKQAPKQSEKQETKATPPSGQDVKRPTPPAASPTGDIKQSPIQRPARPSPAPAEKKAPPPSRPAKPPSRPPPPTAAGQAGTSSPLHAPKSHSQQAPPPHPPPPSHPPTHGRASGGVSPAAASHSTPTEQPGSPTLVANGRDAASPPQASEPEPAPVTCSASTERESVPEPPAALEPDDTEAPENHANHAENGVQPDGVEAEVVHPPPPPPIDDDEDPQEPAGEPAPPTDQVDQPAEESVAPVEPEAVANGQDGQSVENPDPEAAP